MRCREGCKEKIAYWKSNFMQPEKVSQAVRLADKRSILVEQRLYTSVSCSNHHEYFLRSSQLKPRTLPPLYCHMDKVAQQVADLDLKSKAIKARLPTAAINSSLALEFILDKHSLKLERYRED